MESFVFIFTAFVEVANETVQLRWLHNYCPNLWRQNCLLRLVWLMQRWCLAIASWSVICESLIHRVLNIFPWIYFVHKKYISVVSYISSTNYRLSIVYTDHDTSPLFLNNQLKDLKQACEVCFSFWQGNLLITFTIFFALLHQVVMAFQVMKQLVGVVAFLKEGGAQGTQKGLWFHGIVNWLDALEGTQRENVQQQNQDSGAVASGYDRQRNSLGYGRLQTALAALTSVAV